MIVLGLGLLAIGGWPFVMWGIFFRTCLPVALDLVREFSDAHVGLASASPPMTIRAICGGWPTSASAKAGTTIITRIRSRRGTAWRGMSSI